MTALVRLDPEKKSAKTLEVSQKMVEAQWLQSGGHLRRRFPTRFRENTFKKKLPGLEDPLLRISIDLRGHGPQLDHCEAEARFSTAGYHRLADISL